MIAASRLQKYFDGMGNDSVLEYKGELGRHPFEPVGQGMPGALLLKYGQTQLLRTYPIFSLFNRGLPAAKDSQRQLSGSACGKQLYALEQIIAIRPAVRVAT